MYQHNGDIVINNSYKPLDYYNDDDVELDYLLSTPTCFLIIGKPFCGKTTLARKLAIEWTCPLIHPDGLIEEAIKSNTRIGQVCMEFLDRGLKIEKDLIYTLVKDKMQTPGLQNIGYVLDGFPTLSDHGLHVPDQLTLMENWSLQPNVIIHIKMSDDDIMKRKKNCKVNPLEGTVYVEEELKRISTSLNGSSSIDVINDDYEVVSQEEINLPDTDDDEYEIPDASVIETLVSFPTQHMRQFTKELERYNRKFPLLMNYIMNHPKVMKIELNGNLPPKTLFKGLMSTLKLMPISKPIHPILMSELPDYDLIEEFNTQNFHDLMFTLNKFSMIAPFFRWRVSRWGNVCPVELTKGNLVVGFASKAVLYRDKMYFLSHDENLQLFLQNPRPYLIPPMPLPPCKLIIFGHLKTGRTSLAWRLAAKYKGRVIDFDDIIQTYARDKREQHLEDVWYENLLETISDIQTREILTAAVMVEEAAAKRLHDLATENALRILEARERERKITAARSRTHSSAPSRVHSTALVSSTEEVHSSEQDLRSTFEELYAYSLTSDTVLDQIKETALDIAFIEEDHPEVVAIINNIMEAAVAEDFHIEENQYIHQLLKEIEAQRLILNFYGSKEIRDGGWIIDNFPADEKLFKTAVSMGIMPVGIVILKDPTDEYKIVSKRFVKSRLRKRTLATMSQRSPMLFEANEDETSSESVPDFDRLMEEDYLEEEEEMQSASSSASTLKVEDITEAKPRLTESEIALVKLKETLSEMDTFFTTLPRCLPTDGCMVKIITVQITNQNYMAYTGDSDGTTPEEFPNSSRFDSSQRFHTMSDVQSQATRSDLIAVHDIAASIPRIHKSPEDIAAEVISSLEAEFYYKCTVFDDNDRDQQEADIQQNVDIIIDSKNEEDIPLNLWQLGDYGPYCPVVFKENWILHPGKRDLEAKFKDKSYCFSSEEARDEFMRNPLRYIDNKKPLKLPPVRICFVGPFGSQRTDQARLIAQSLNVFHINFRERLQELLLPKSGRKLGFPYQTDREQMEDEEILIEAESIPESIRTSFEDDSRGSQGSVGWSEQDNSELQSSSKRSTQPSESESQETPRESQVEDYISVRERFTEEEKNFKDYLQNGTPINESSLEALVTPWWYQEPYCSVGFILDGFPNNVEEAEFLITHGLIPDSIIFMIVSDLDVVEKLQTLCMNTWMRRRDLRRAKRDEERKLAKENRDNSIAQRRLELEEEFSVKRESEKSAREVEDETEDEEFVDEEINEIIEGEFPEEEEAEDEDDETVEEAENRYNNHLLEMLQQYEETSSLVKELFQATEVPFHYIDGRKKVSKVTQNIRTAISGFVDRRENLLERTYAITTSLADRLITSGYKMRSKFGYWCPVQVYDGAIIPPFYANNQEPLPVLHRHHIYFLSSASAQERFLKEPLKYICQPLPPPIVPINMAILGTPCSGKSTLAKRFAKELNLVRLTGPQLIRFILNKMSQITISDSIRQCLENGEAVPPELLVAAVDEVMMHPICQQQGIILDEFPNTLELAETLAERNIIPFCLLELNLPLKEVARRVSRRESTEENNFKTPYELLKFQYHECTHELDQLKEYYEQKHHNWVSLDANRSQWWLWVTASAKFFEYARSVQNYIVSMQKGEAAELHNMNLTPEEFKAGLGVFKQFCPVSLALEGELIDCTGYRNHEFCAEYNGKYYSMCSKEHLNVFISNPDMFLPPRAIRLPPKGNEIPQLLSAEKWAKHSKSQIEFGGFCTVTYVLGLKTYESLVKGNPKYGVLFNSKVYLFASEEKRNLFMRKPELYAYPKLPNKLPPDPPEASLLDLPILGYLEQTVASAIVKTLSVVGSKKPKYPFLDISRSAALYFAYHLKANNPKNPPYVRKKFQEKLEEFARHSQLLQYVIKNMTLMPFKNEKTPTDFDEKLKIFFDLKPKPEWLLRMATLPKPGTFYEAM